MSLSRWLMPLALCLGALGLAAPPAAAQSTEGERGPRVGRLAMAAGKVWVYDTEAQDWTEAQANRPLVQGDRIAVDPDGRAELRLGAVVLRLSGDSELELQALDEGQAEAWLVNGAVALQVLTDTAARQTRLRTREGRFEPLGRGHFRLEADEAGSHVGVWRGAMQFLGPENLLRIDAGERYRVWLAADTGYARSESEPMPSDNLAAWALAAEREPVYGAADVPDGVVGAEDLGRYGHWSLHAELGRVWIPARVPAGWAPYTQGRWVWVRPWGWTWVDSAPWGFAPFHYGRWLTWGGRWVWWPGPAHARAVFAPALVFQFGGPALSVGVSIDLGLRHAPPVSWVPLAPYQPYVPVWRPLPQPYPHHGHPPVVVLPPPHHHPDRRINPPRSRPRADNGRAVEPSPATSGHPVPATRARPVPGDGSARAERGDRGAKPEPKAAAPGRRDLPATRPQPAPRHTEPARDPDRSDAPRGRAADRAGRDDRAAADDRRDDGRAEREARVERRPRHERGNASAPPVRGRAEVAAERRASSPTGRARSEDRAAVPVGPVVTSTGFEWPARRAAAPAAGRAASTQAASPRRASESGGGERRAKAGGREERAGTRADR